MVQQQGHSQKLYYTIGEVAELFSVNTSLIRYYDKEFNVLKPHKNKKGNRLFTQGDVELLRRIISLTKVEGYSIAETRDKVKKSTSKPEIKPEIKPEDEVRKKLNRMKMMLQKILETLD